MQKVACVFIACLLIVVNKNESDCVYIKTKKLVILEKLILFKA